MTNGWRPRSNVASKLTDKTDVIEPDTSLIKPSGLNLTRHEEAVSATIVARGFNGGIVKKPHISVMLADAYSIIAEELRKLREKSEAGEALTETESRKFATYTAQLARLAAEEREQQKQDKIDELSDKELIEQAEKAMHLLGIGKK